MDATSSDVRWSRWLLERNRSGLRTTLWIALLLYICFALLDIATAPRTALPLMLGMRVVVVAVTLCMFAALRGPWLERFPYALACGYMLLCSCSISIMSVFTGGLSSPYYAGLSLVVVATGLLFVWPPRIAVVTNFLVVASFPLVNLLHAPHLDFTAGSNLAFLLSTALIATAGQVLLFTTHARQVKGQIELEEAKAGLEKAAADLRELARFKSEFFANITHELRTPLAMILSPLEMLQAGQMGPVSSAQQKTFSSMFRSGLKLLKMIGDLLDLARLEESRLHLRVAEHDLVDLLRGLIAQTAGLAERKQLELRLDAAVERAFVWCDAEQLERVFVNLLANAIKFSPGGGRIEVRVDEVRAAAGDSRLHVEVRDQGPGFPPESAEKLFDRFYQVEMGGTRRYGGAGIGLALARELVELHGGSILAESPPGGGARFTVELRFGRAHYQPEQLAAAPGPSGESRSDWVSQVVARRDFRLVDAADAVEVAEPADPPEEDATARPHRTVLVVDDLPEVARLVHLALHEEFRVIAARDGAQGLEMALRERPSLVVADWMMPGVTGPELLRRLRADPATQSIPAILLTARADLGDKLEGIESGANAYLTKPFSPRELLTTARQLVSASEKTHGLSLSQRMDSLEIVAAGFSHEINNPLNYVKNALIKLRLDSGEASALLRGGLSRPLPPEEQARLLRVEERMADLFDVAASGVERIARTVELLRGYGLSGYPRAPRPCDVRAAAEEVVTLVLPSTGRKVKVEVAAAGEVLVECVPGELRQILTVLAQNAIEAASGDGHGLVHIAARREGEEVVLRVRDNGPGIPPEDHARLFTPFFTTKGPDHGQGLGLNICWRVVHGLGGSIEVRSPAEGGTEFVVRLPARAIPTMQASAGRSAALG